ncbi:penicillin-binding protein 2 [Anaeromyxobacter sp. Fw109-5]|uniref:penicillin-binding protein 2 n=1 Tax=Anaeromyxobacter sp. (strain Fw109-5) TaxID=404589 RepID=UPI0000ED7D15|nr:penicillin-binding protein 2 [Anaeromyxobacter sp. Fw109-5]ABS25577.1 Peptidoglycan glycosyltransferase [Anaeromyxobacter sp. Fw109-5]
MSLIPPSAPGTAQKDFRPRLAWATGLAVLTFLTLVGRLYLLQILKGDEYKEKAEENFVKEIRQPADRGHVLDRHGRILVDSRPSYDVTLTPYFCGKQCDEVLSRLATMLAMTPEEVERARGQLAGARKLERFRPFTVKVDIAREELDLFLARQMDLPGVDVQAIPHRNYRFGGLGGHLIGYMNEAGPEELKRLNEEVQRSGTGQGPYLLGDYTGRRGLERRFERQLRGIDGKERVPVDAKGRRKEDADELIPEDQRVVPSVPGHNLVLSIDWRLQEAAEAAFPATAGVVLAMDAKTGFLLALVDRPAPDPNKMSGRITSAELAAIHSDPLEPELFRAIQQHYHPGSTFKALTAIAALEEKHYHPGTTVFCPGHFKMGRHRWRCDKDSGHGYVDFAHALGASCDVFFYEAGARLGADALARWAREFGLGVPTEFGLPGEVPGVVPDVAWHDRHLRGGYQRGMPVNLAIGQGDVNVTPMQQVVFYGALATGIVWKPQVVLRVEDADGKVLQEFAPQERSRPQVKKSTRDTVMKGLLAAVNEPYGTAYWQRIKEFTVAGKTGTAQVVKMGKRLRADQVPYFERDHAWFAAFAPAEDPEIVVVVLNEHSGFGSTNAAPTAMAVIRKYLELKAQDAAERAGVALSPPALGAAPGAAPAATAPAPAAAVAGPAALRGAKPAPTGAPAAAPPPSRGAQVVPTPLATSGAAAVAPAAMKPKATPVEAKSPPAAAKPSTPVEAKPSTPAPAKPSAPVAKPSPPVETEPVAPAASKPLAPEAPPLEPASPPVAAPAGAAPAAPTRSHGERQGGNDGGA